MMVAPIYPYKNEELAFITYELYQIKPLIRTRYSKIEIASHFGNEFYCPNSLVRAHGKPMMEEFKDADNGASVTMKEIMNPPSDLNTSFEKCKVVTPYLALKEFLRDLNPSSNYCDVPLSVNECVVYDDQ
ncbi:hypothetical protein OXX79_006551 [Metschnikowia pulcherrima]